MNPTSHSNIVAHNLFITPVLEFQLDLDTGVLEKFCYDTRNRLSKGVQISNVGGWQSPGLKGKQHPEFEKLKQRIVEASLKYHNYVRFKKTLNEKISNIWININGKWHSNEYHHHGFATISGTYYVTGGSNIVFRHPLQYLNDFFWRKNIIEEFSTTNSSVHEFTPKPNTLLLFPPWIEHKVELNDKEDERISIAFNMILEQEKKFFSDAYRPHK